MKEILQKVDFFSGLDEKLLEQVADAAIMRHYGKDESVVEQGQTGLGMYVVVKGSVRVVRRQGPVEKEVARLGPEQVFAEMAILDDQPRSADVITNEDTQCLLLTRDSFVKLMRRNPEIPIRVARVLAERLRDANELLASGASAPAAAAVIDGGAAPPHAANGNGTPPVSRKNQMQDTMLSIFDKLYTMKALTRFSVAVLGCPVEAAAPNIHDQIRAGDVKAVIVPAGEPVDLRIVAGAEGAYTLNVFTPGQPGRRCYGPGAIAPADAVTLHLEGDRLRLNRGADTLVLKNVQPLEDYALFRV
ncbi:MAG: cyclic nucleotide-binding domain-containing protein [Bryobacteraceae bacterium]